MKKVLMFSMLLGTLASGCSHPHADVAPADLRTSSSDATALAGDCAPVTVDFMAGQHTDAGDVTVTNDLTNVYVTFTTTGAWVMKESHLYVGGMDGLPVGKGGNPKIGNFPYKTTYNPKASTYTYTIPRSTLGNDPCLVVAAHAAVVRSNPDGSTSGGETAWGAGNAIKDGGSWATYFVYCVCPAGNTTGGTTTSGTTTSGTTTSGTTTGTTTSGTTSGTTTTGTTSGTTSGTTTGTTSGTTSGTTTSGTTSGTTTDPEDNGGGAGGN